MGSINCPCRAGPSDAPHEPDGMPVFAGGRSRRAGGRTMIHRIGLGHSILPIVLVGAVCGCQMNEVTVNRTACRQPVYRQPVRNVALPTTRHSTTERSIAEPPNIERPITEIADPWAAPPQIRPGHSLDVDNAAHAPSSRTPAGVTEPPAENESDDLATRRNHRSPASSAYDVGIDYMVPPPPIPSRNRDGSSKGAAPAVEQSAPAPDLDSDSQNAAPLSQGRSGDLTAPNLASPFSVRGLYQRLRGSTAGQSKIETAASSARVCEYKEASNVSQPVALGCPEPLGGPSDSRTVAPSAAVMQACPSCFQWPMWAEPPGERNASSMLQ